jgi:hypothetical protein
MASNVAQAMLIAVLANARVGCRTIRAAPSDTMQTPQNARRPHPARSLVQPFENMTATLIPIDGGYKRRVNRPAASAVAKASGEGSFLRAKEGAVREGGGRAGRIGCKPLHLLALPGARASGRFISLPLRQLPLNMLKESLVDVPKPC